jgi:2-polyprenyl-3-methyl-5-hydroxy-6-metoxy-1,4-benzoquinol methylase
MGPDPIGTPAWAPPHERGGEGGGEYVWEHEGPREIHSYLTQPIVTELSAAGAHSVLELGCGNGWFSAGLHNCGFDVTGVDQSESGLRLATRRYPELNFQRQDVMHDLHPSLVGRFDAVVSIDLIDHLPLPRRLVQAALLALKPGGLLIVTSAYHGYVKNLALALTGKLDSHLDPLRDHGRVKFFSRASLLALLGEFGLSNVRFQSVGSFPLLARAMLASASAPA